MHKLHDVFLAYKNLNKFDYTCEYSEKAKKSSYTNQELLSSDQHSKMSETDFSEYFSSQEKLISWYFNYLDNINQIDVISVIGNRIKRTYNSIDSGNKNRLKIVSFGSGPSVLEFYLKSIFQNKIEILCCDYDQFMMKQCEKLFTNMSFSYFDFYQNDYSKITNFRPDIAILIGSGCSMDNKQYISFLKNLRMMGIKEIFLFEAGIFSSLKCLHYGVATMVKAVFWGYENNHNFHAYARTPIKLKKIYKKSGFKFESIKGMRTFHYAYHLVTI